MQYLLDTSILIDFLRKKQKVYDFLSHRESDQFVTSALCAFELESGVYRLESRDRALHQKKVTDLLQSLYDVVPFSRKEAEIAGVIQARLSASGTIIDDLDILIAATAISSHSTLVTGNQKHFSRILNLDSIAI